MEVIFAAWAERCLREIYDYYSEEASPEKASEIVNKIIDRAETIENYPGTQTIHTANTSNEVNSVFVMVSLAK